MINFIRNMFRVFVDQLPLTRMYKNFFITKNGRGVFSKRSHLTILGTPKVMYNTKRSATKAATKLMAKKNCYYSVYKCLYCDGYHLGRNRDAKKR